MKVLDNPHRIFSGDPGETITVKITPNNVGSGYGITYSFNQATDGTVLPEGQDITFALPGGKVTILRVFFHFNDGTGTGGSYDVRVLGSKGGQLDEPPVVEAGLFVPGRKHTFVS